MGLKASQTSALMCKGIKLETSQDESREEPGRELSDGGTFLRYLFRCYTVPSY